MHFLDLKEGMLLVTYLGVPLVSTAMKKDHLKRLIERIIARITSWIAKNLSYVGRLQLINSVLRSLLWCYIFILPKFVVYGTDKRFRSFLRLRTGEGGRKIIVAWDKVCRSKNEGGLGIKEVMSWNKAAVEKQVWYLVAIKSSLWTS